jgi:hypothetical protein
MRNKENALILQACRQRILQTKYTNLLHNDELVSFAASGLEGAADHP